MSDELLRQPCYSLTGEWLNDARRACVYVWRRADEVLYVGCATKGLARVLGPHHKLTRNAIRKGDAIDVYRCQNPAAAVRLEQDLIRALKPSLNGRAAPAMDRDDPSVYSGLKATIAQHEADHKHMHAALNDIAFKRVEDAAEHARKALGWKDVYDPPFGYGPIGLVKDA